MHRARRSSIAYSFAGIVAMHNGTKVYILRSIFHEAWVNVARGAQGLAQGSYKCYLWFCIE